MTLFFDCKDHVGIFDSSDGHLVPPHYFILLVEFYLDEVRVAYKPSRIHVCSGLVEDKVDITRTIEPNLFIHVLISRKNFSVSWSDPIRTLC